MVCLEAFRVAEGFSRSLWTFKIVVKDFKSFKGSLMVDWGCLGFKVT